MIVTGVVVSVSITVVVVSASVVVVSVSVVVVVVSVSMVLVVSVGSKVGNSVPGVVGMATPLAKQS